MDEEVKVTRSPRSPSTPLTDAIEQARKLHSQIGRAKVKPESAVIALGYKGLNGAALSTLGTLSQYGLIDRSGSQVAITPLALKILHPTGEDQRREALRDAALNPPIFREIQKQYDQCSVEVLTSHLVQQNFTPDRARKTASIYAENKGFANLSAPNGDTQETTQAPDISKQGQSPFVLSEVKVDGPQAVLARYSIPLIGNEATITFVGEDLTADDFDALKEFIDYCKKQFQRKQAAASAQRAG